MTERRKKLLKWLGYPVLGTVTFLFALHFTFPYERLRERLVTELSKSYDVGIAEIGPGWFPGHIKVTGLSVTSRPEREDEKPKTFVLDEVHLAIGILPLITKTISVDIDAQLGSGSISGNVSTSSSGLSFDLTAKDLSLESVPGIGVVTGGVPIKGPVEAHFQLNLPKNKWASASGVVELSCAGCSVGDGVAKWRPTSSKQIDAFTNAGFTLPRLDIGQFTAKIPISKGVACLSKFETSGGNIFVLVEGGVRFQDPFGQTQAEIQARIKTSDEFKKDPNAAIFSGIKDSEGWLTYQTRSPLVALRWGPGRGVMSLMRECEGVAPPPTPPKTAVAHGAAPPSNPVPPGELAPPAAPTPEAPVAPPAMPEPTPAPTPTPEAAPTPPPAPTEIPSAPAPAPSDNGSPPPPQPPPAEQPQPTQ